MPVTRDRNFPGEIAQLLQAFNLCADGHDAPTVLNAGLQLVAAAVGYIAKDKGATLDDALAYFRDTCVPTIELTVQDNWARTPSSSDVPVVKQ